TFHNQQAALQPKSLYSSSLPVHSTAQVFNGSHLKQITSQPQIITTQAGTMLGQAQFLGSLQALGSLPQGISWATPGCLQSSTLLTQNPIIIRSQQSDMFIQSPPQTAMHLPVAAATAPVPPTTCTPLAPQKPKQVRSGTQTVAVATQTVVSSAATVNSNATPIRTQIRPKSKLPTGSSPGASPSPLAPQMATTQTQTSQSHSQPQHQPTPQQKSDAANQTHSNQVKPVVPVASETKSTATQSKSIAIETKPLPPSLPVKSHAMVAPSTKIVQTTVSSTIGISTITSSSSTTPVSCAPVTTTATTANASTSVSAAVNTSPVLPYTPPASTNIAPEDVCPADDDTKPVSAPEESVEPVAQQTEPIELIESEPLKPQQPITKLPLGNVKEKLQKAIVKPQVLTHVIDGFVIQEGPEPFPVSRSSLFDSAEKLKKTEDSPIAASPEKKMKIHRPRGNVELAKCEFCGKMGPKSKFKRSKRFCSTSCAKRYNVCCSKRVGLLPSAVQENVAAGPGRKRKAGFKGRKGLRKQSQNENVEVSATQFEENTKSLKDESVLPVKIEDDNIEPAEGNPCPIVIQSEKEEEMEVVKSESEVIRKLPNKWSVQEVFQFICDLPGCSDYADEFRSQEIDGQALLLLKEDHLMNAMNMKLGPALKLISQINSIKEELSHS
ncbi:polyhomeotic-like protein 3, partial [Stegodyphus dumicola]|uniref:polyhomeotic-like protein 3 n=1 Tax=Stegodyphus dumicola TaxID=202533 RepID=UPI0015A9C1F6